MPYTDADIQEALDSFFSTIAHRQYTGARYVPILGRKDETSIEWDNSAPYEPLTIVTYQGNSYTSRQEVPAGVSIMDASYWAATGNYNAQVEQYRIDIFDALEDIQDTIAQFDDCKQIRIDSGFNNTDMFAWHVAKIPRDSWNIDICAGDGTYTGMSQGYALDIIHADTEHKWSMLANIGFNTLELLNGNIVYDEPSSSYPLTHKILAFKPNGDCRMIETPGITATDLLALGYLNAVEIWDSIIVNGAKSCWTGRTEPSRYANRTAFGYDADYWYVCVTDGRCTPSLGASWTALQDFLYANYPDIDWYMCDGGGSSQLYIACAELNLVAYHDGELPVNYARPRRTFVRFKRKDGKSAY